jgi:DNA mismatch endonuclease (patch repair protein)
MALVRGKDTKPEQLVRRLIHKLGYRFRLHRRDLPGKPDIVFPRKKAVIFVHGCFWHQHPDPSCKLARMPKTRLDFWKPKLEGNRVRDERSQSELEKLGWRVLAIWECQLKDEAALTKKIQDFLGPVQSSK